MSYRQRLQMRLVRTVHEIRVGKDASAHSVKADLGNVPDGAVLEDWDMETSINEFVLTFVEERPDDDG